MEASGCWTMSFAEVSRGVEEYGDALRSLLPGGSSGIFGQILEDAEAGGEGTGEDRFIDDEIFVRVVL